MKMDLELWTLMVRTANAALESLYIFNHLSRVPGNDDWLTCGLLPIIFSIIVSMCAYLFRASWATDYCFALLSLFSFIYSVPISTPSCLSQVFH